MDRLINQLIAMIISTEDEDRSYVPFRGGSQDQVVALVNNLGGLSELELGSISGEIRHQLQAKGLSVQRLISGTFMVSRGLALIVTYRLMPNHNKD